MNLEKILIKISILIKFILKKIIGCGCYKIGKTEIYIFMLK